MLMSQQVRILSDEEEILKDTTQYSITGPADWTDKLSKTFNTSKQLICYVDIYIQPTNGYIAGRVLVDDLPILSTGMCSSMYGAMALFILASGTHTIKFQLAAEGSPSGGYTTQCTIGLMNFKDYDYEEGDSGNKSAPVGGSNVLQINFTAPTARTLPIGQVKTFPVQIQVYVENTSDRANVLKNTGESNDSDRLNWNIKFDAIQRDWTWRKDDYGDGANPTYGIGAAGRLLVNVEPGSNHTVKIDVYNGFSVSKTVRAVVKIEMCPWIMGIGEYDPFTLNFPQGSTLYVVLEPLFANNTKYVKLGKKRAVSFGDSTDYYSLSSGTGILSWSYTFEAVEVGNSVLTVDGGYGACVSIIGVDVRG